MNTFKAPSSVQDANKIPSQNQGFSFGTPGSIFRNNSQSYAPITTPASTQSTFQLNSKIFGEAISEAATGPILNNN